MDQGMTVDLFNKEKSLEVKYNEILAREEVFWKQKSRECWLKEGDRNTNFFHNSVKIRWSWNKVTSIRSEDNSILDKVEEINKAAVEFLSELLKQNDSLNISQQNRLLENIPKVITESQNQMLCKPIQLEEVRQAVFFMAGEGSGALWITSFFLSTVLGSIWL